MNPNPIFSVTPRSIHACMLSAIVSFGALCPDALAQSQRQPAGPHTDAAGQPTGQGSGLDLTSGGGPGVLYFGGGNPAFVGWTYKFVEQEGTFRPVKPAFSVTVNQNTGAGQGKLELWQYTSAGQKFHMSSLEANVAYSASVVKASATYAQSSEVSSGVFGASVFLGYQVDYPDAIVDLAHMTSVDFAPDAWAIINSGMSQQQKQQAWIAAGFGPMVAIGYDLEGYLGVKLSLAETQSFEARNQYFSIVGSYYGASAGLTMAGGVQEALSTSSLSMILDFGGLTQPQVASIPLPTAAMAQDTALMEAWELNIKNIAAYAKQPSGLFLAPCFALPGGPNVNVPPWDEYLLTTAAIKTNDAMGTLSAMSLWNEPASLKYFLQHQVNSITGNTLDADLATSREALRNAIIACGDRVRDYMQGESYSDPLVVAALQAIVQQVQLTEAQAKGTLLAVLARIEALPAMSLTLMPNGTWHPVGNNTAYVPLRIQVTNVGIFRENAWTAIEAALQEDRLTIFETNATVSNQPNTFSNSALRYMVLQESILNTTGPGAGLRTLIFDLEINTVNHLLLLKARLIDEFDRQASMSLAF